MWKTSWYRDNLGSITAISLERKYQENLVELSVGRSFLLKGTRVAVA
jgi:hypothetical protein